MKKHIIIFGSLALVFGATLFFSSDALAQTGPYLGVEYGEYTGLGGDDIRKVVAQMINIVLALLGIIFLVICVYAGFRLMTAAGNEDAVRDARKILFAGVAGLAIVLAAYSISKFVLSGLYQATSGDKLELPGE